jgi:uncharacterized protein YjiS (DUF1127 family)
MSRPGFNSFHLLIGVMAIPRALAAGVIPSGQPAIRIAWWPVSNHQEIAMSCARMNRSAVEIPRATPVRAGYPLIASLLSLWAACAWLRERQRQRQALLELDEHLLDDIGLTREQALAKGRKRFWE